MVPVKKKMMPIPASRAVAAFSTSLAPAITGVFLRRAVNADIGAPSPVTASGDSLGDSIQSRGDPGETHAASPSIKKGHCNAWGIHCAPYDSRKPIIARAGLETLEKTLRSSACAGGREAEGFCFSQGRWKPAHPTPPDAASSRQP